MRKLTTSNYYTPPWYLNGDGRYISSTGSAGAVWLRSNPAFIGWHNIIGVDYYYFWDGSGRLTYAQLEKRRYRTISYLGIPHKTYLFMEADICLRHVTPRY